MGRRGRDKESGRRQEQVKEKESKVHLFFFSKFVLKSYLAVLGACS